jgi:hypothetical protein
LHKRYRSWENAPPFALAERAINGHESDGFLVTMIAGGCFGPIVVDHSAGMGPLAFQKTIEHKIAALKRVQRTVAKAPPCNPVADMWPLKPGPLD